MFTGYCLAGNFISFHDLFYLVLEEKKPKQWSENHEQSARKYEHLGFEEEERLIHQPSSKEISL